jgi:hypothetical protein
MSTRNKILLFCGVVLLVVFSFGGYLLLEIARSTPSERIVKREFLSRYPNTNISNIELIFEQDGAVVYMITARENQAAEQGKYEFALSRKNGDWRWCDDQTDNPCGSIAK